jgi:uncharacterized membrane protein
MRHDLVLLERMLHWGRFLAQDGREGRDWVIWPFSPGFGETWLAAGARMLFVAAILGVVALLLRFLYGPKGRWRPKEFGTEHIERRNELNARIRKEKERVARGELTKGEFIEKARQMRREDEKR